ncbi:hypothetical protein LTS18_011973, partial [Coniosporium uncinatum]
MPAAARCTSCRNAAFRSIASLAGVELPLRSSRGWQTRLPQASRLFNTSHTVRSAQKGESNALFGDDFADDGLKERGNTRHEHEVRARRPSLATAVKGESNALLSDDFADDTTKKGGRIRPGRYGRQRRASPTRMPRDKRSAVSGDAENTLPEPANIYLGTDFQQKADVPQQHTPEDQELPSTDTHSQQAVHEHSARVESQLQQDLEAIDLEELENDTSTPHDPSLPWYLQPQSSSSTNTAHPFPDHQNLPSLPLNPPPALHPILTHLSHQIGLDDLSILDLRTLDPPAALGSNLIMLFGNARSEKHLHVSADRFCRWLRAEHALRPRADGLLGRNELKLRAKRKAKRSRLLAAAGTSSMETGTSSSGEGGDDNKMGWICCTIGRVEAAEGAGTGGFEEAALESEEGGFVGFGTRRSGVTLVVQMFTERRREELDLEGLWSGVLEKQEARKAKGLEEQRIQHEVSRVGQDPAYGGKKAASKGEGSG